MNNQLTVNKLFKAAKDEQSLIKLEWERAKNSKKAKVMRELIESKADQDLLIYLLMPANSQLDEIMEIRYESINIIK